MHQTFSKEIFFQFFFFFSKVFLVQILFYSNHLLKIKGKLGNRFFNATLKYINNN